MCVYWEAICQDLDESPFVLCSWGGGFEEFAYGLSTTGVSDEEVCGFCGCDRFYLGVLFGGWWVCFVEVLEVVFEPFLSCFPGVSLKGVSSLFSGGSVSWKVCFSPFCSACVNGFFVNIVFPLGSLR